MASCWFIGSAFLTGATVSGTDGDTAGRLGSGGASRAASVSCGAFDVLDGADGEIAAPLTSRNRPVSLENRCCAAVNSSWVVRLPRFWGAKPFLRFPAPRWWRLYAKASEAEYVDELPQPGRLYLCGMWAQDFYVFLIAFFLLEQVI